MPLSKSELPSAKGSHMWSDTYRWWVGLWTVPCLTSETETARSPQMHHEDTVGVAVPLQPLAPRGHRLRASFVFPPSQRWAQCLCLGSTQKSCHTLPGLTDPGPPYPSRSLNAITCSSYFLWLLTFDTERSLLRKPLTCACVIFIFSCLHVMWATQI